jgi:hypothetical protein
MELPRFARSWYSSSIDDFGASTTETILGALAKNGSFAVLETQRDAWISQIAFLREGLRGLSGAILFEFSIPRMGRRIDVVLLIAGVVFVVEFKVGASTFDGVAMDQVWDYALDLKNFHEASHHLPIVRLLVATDAVDVPTVMLHLDADGVVRPVAVSAATFRDLIGLGVSRFAAEEIDAERWAAASYRPTPTIIEAARALYAQHSVECDRAT